MTFSAPETIGFVNRVSGVPNLGILIAFCLVVVLGAAARILIVYWHDPSERLTVRRWQLVYGAIIVGLVVLFSVGDAPVERRTDFETYYATTPYIVEFTLLYLIAQMVALVSVIRRCWQWAHVAGQPWLKLGLRLIAFGATCGMGVSITRILAVVARWFDANWDYLNSRASVVCALAGLTVGAFGFALPAWGDRLTRVYGWANRVRAYRQLYPLWDAMRRAIPAIVLPAPIPWWDFDVRLTRRLAEINDGRLALRSFTDPDVSARAVRLGQEAGLTGADLDAVVQAAGIRAALTAKAASLPSRAESGTEHRHAHGGSDGIGELAWLCKVARAFTHSAVVAAAARDRAVST
jgi:hypothetical protein